MLLLYFLLWTAVAANKEPFYKKIGDEAVLTSDSVVNPITSIEWKHGPDLAMEWYGGEITAYRHFRDRGSLNTSTGALTITGLTPDDSGIYTVDINNKVTSKTELLVISPVSKPTVSIRCEREMIYCVLTCNGDTTGAEPVTYRWTSGDITWSSTKEHNITKEDNELWFSCAFENSVSFISSEKVRNPFNKEPLYRKIGDKAVLTPDSVVNPIKSIAWTHGPSIAIEWFRNGDETSSYRQFKDRGRLNTSTGALTITGLTPDDSGNYTVEINNKVTSKTQLLVISLVSKPTISVWCVMIYCVLTCNGDTTGAEPVTYRWTSGNTTWSSTKEHKITKEDKEPWFSCAFENPVSFNSSEKVPNPFIKWVLIWTFIFIAVFILVVCIIIIYFRCTRRAREAQRTWQEFLQRWDKEFQEMLDEVNSKMSSELNKTSTQETAESPDTSNETGEAAVRKWQEMLKRLRKEFLKRLAEGEAAERRRQEFLETYYKGKYDHWIWQEYLEKKRKGEAAERARQAFQERRDKGEAAERKLQDEAAERRWQEFLQRWDEEFQEMLNKGAAERRWQEMLNRLREEFLKRLAEGEAAERAEQEFLETYYKGKYDHWKWQEYLEKKRYREAAERARQAFQERRDKGEAAERRRQGEAAERRRQGEAAERRWQEFLKKWDTEYLERLDKGEAAERKWQEMLERLREALEVKRRQGGYDYQTGQEFLKRNNMVKSKISEINKTSTQDPTSVVTQDTSNETEMSVLLPPVENPSTQDPISVVTQDPSNETEESPMIPHNAETRC